MQIFIAACLFTWSADKPAHKHIYQMDSGCAEMLVLLAMEMEIGKGNRNGYKDKDGWLTQFTPPERKSLKIPWISNNIKRANMFRKEFNPQITPSFCETFDLVNKYLVTLALNLVS